MLGIKKTVINQTQLDSIPTHCLATQVIRRGSFSQKKELAQFLSDIAIVQLSAIDILVFAIETVLKAQNGITPTFDTPLHINIVTENEPILNEYPVLSIKLQESTFLKSYFSSFIKTISSFFGGNIRASVFVYAAYLLETINVTVNMKIPCSHCLSKYNSEPKNLKCCSIKNNIREFIVVLIRISLNLDSSYIMQDNEMTELVNYLGLSVNPNYYNHIKNILLPKIDISFSLSKYEEYLAEKTIAFHLSHFPLAGKCNICGKQKRIYPV